jgi:hypothetical protein
MSAFILQDIATGLHAIHSGVRFSGKPLPAPRKGCEGTFKPLGKRRSKVSHIRSKAS